MKLGILLALFSVTPSLLAQSATSVYPFVPYQTENLQERVKVLTEKDDFLKNIYEINEKELLKRNTSVQPWGGHYWSLNNGMVAVDYHDPLSQVEIIWQWNAKDFEKRVKKIHSRINELSQKELNHLSPTEKYDVLMGDESFDLTNRIWDYSTKVGSEDRFAFLSSIDLPEGYVLPRTDDFMALWEGICHGWAIAAGHSPRPEKTVRVELPNGKELPFYPDDLKALTSLMWAHSNIQNHVLFEGGRCNQEFPKRDKYGRYIDTQIEPGQTELKPNCADVHPAIFHMSLINILGVEGRSFVIDHKAEGPVANQPVSGYEFSYFNPLSGKKGDFKNSVLSLKEMGKKDKFASARNLEATHVVGVAMNLKYVNWAFPTRKETDSVQEDKIVDMKFNYDLELDSEGNIVGGQWRIQRNGDPLLLQKPNHPDFFWVVPRDWGSYFKGNETLPVWDFELSNLPPVEYKGATRFYHTAVLARKSQCVVIPENGRGGSKKVDCEFRDPKPQPLINVVQKLLELSQK